MALSVAMIAYTHYDSDPRVRREAEALAGRGDQVQVWCLGKEGAPAEEESEGVLRRTLSIPRYRGGQAAAYVASYGRFMAWAFAEVARAHARQRFDLVHVHTMPDFMVLAALVPRLTGAKLLLDMHDLMPELYALKFQLARDGAAVRALKWVQRGATALADAVVAVHENQYRLLLAAGVPAHKLAIVMNAADPKLFPPREAEPPVRDRIEVVYHGTVLHRYGVDLAVRAFAEARQEEPRLFFSLLGGGDYVEEVRALAAELGLGPEALFMSGEHRPLAEIAARIRGAHLGLVPNRDDQEDSVLPTKLLEYVAVGIPAVAARTRTVGRFFDEHQVELVPVGDVPAMAQAILRVARDAKRRRSLVAAAHAWEEEYGYAVNMRNLFRVVDALCFEALAQQKAEKAAAKSEAS